MCPSWAGNRTLIPETAMRAYKRPSKSLLAPAAIIGIGWMAVRESDVSPL